LHASTRFLLKEAFPGRRVVLKVVENRGFDIAPFICEFKDDHAAYDLILKLHTKKSSHVTWLREWRSYLLENLVGSADAIQIILKMFRDDETLGLVYPEIIPPLEKILVKDPWQENWEICRDLSSRLGLTIHQKQRLNFPAGSMFWMRPKALEPLFKLGLQLKDFPKGRRIRRNGTLAHAIERLIVLIAEAQGFSIQQVSFVPYREDSCRTSYYQRIKLKCDAWRGALMDFLGFD